MRLAEIFDGSMKMAKIELKSESWQWEQTGNICIEYEYAGQPSGIAATEADIWVHELKREGGTLVYLMFHTERLKELCRRYWRWRKEKAGDGGRSKVILLPLKDILQ